MNKYKTAHNMKEIVLGILFQVHADGNTEIEYQDCLGEIMRWNTEDLRKFFNLCVAIENMAEKKEEIRFRA